MPRYTTRYMVRLTVLLMLVSIINVADKELLAPVADVVRRDLHMSDTQLGMVRSAVFLAALLGQFFWGPLSDRWVRKYVMPSGSGNSARWECRQRTSRPSFRPIGNRSRKPICGWLRSP